MEGLSMYLDSLVFTLIFFEGIVKSIWSTSMRFWKGLSWSSLWCSCSCDSSTLSLLFLVNDAFCRTDYLCWVSSCLFWQTLLSRAGESLIRRSKIMFHVWSSLNSDLQFNMTTLTTQTFLILYALIDSIQIQSMGRKRLVINRNPAVNYLHPFLSSKGENLRFDFFVYTCVHLRTGCTKRFHMQACKVQCLAMATGSPLHIIDDKVFS